MPLTCFRRGALLLPFFFFIITVQGQEDLPQDYLTAAFHKGRREAARALMPANSVMVVFAAPTRTFSNDIDYLYHQNPDLYYFTGYKEPHAILFLFKEEQTGINGNKYNELFFVQKRNALAERWTGRRLGAEGVHQKLDIQNVYNGEEFKKYTIPFSSFSKIIMAPLPEDVANNRFESADLYDLLQYFREKAGIASDMKNEQIDNPLFREITGRLREIKTPEEMDLIRKAVEISCMGQNEVMKAIRPDMSELEVQGLHEFVHKRYGAEGVGYGSIVGAGENGCILHYMENTKTRIGKDMLLMDVGAEYHGYTADVTRTIPADGVFSPEERAIYQLVYDAQEAAFKNLKNGAKWTNAGNAAKEVIANGLLKLGIIKDKQEVSRYYPHGLSHHIGLDVHDRGFSDTLKKGMVITIEPGIYIPHDSPCDKKWWGIAVRIEDDVLIRENDYELLSHFAPRSIEAIEKMIAEKSVLDNYKLPPLQSSQKKSF
ncbi:MAG: aminopeptidase P N-terminal domain-containing protein [Flavisolibacter sp.]|nr:aminopeptidase P N-terminal domain-containing protein [Flavisolibacter sp.]